MHASVRPYVTAGVALVGASVIAVTPIAASPDIRIADAAVSLAAASVANVPANLINAVLNLPAAEIQGIQRFADAMASSGSWKESSPNNVWGWDPANPEMLKGTIDLLVRFQRCPGPSASNSTGGWRPTFPCMPVARSNAPTRLACSTACFVYRCGSFTRSRGIPFRSYQPHRRKANGVVRPDSEIGPIRARPFHHRLFVCGTGWVPARLRRPVITAVANLAAALQVTGHCPVDRRSSDRNLLQALLSGTGNVDRTGARADGHPGRVWLSARQAPTFEQGQDLGKQAENNVVAGTATNVSSNAAGALDTVSPNKTVAPEADQGLVTATTAVDPTTAVAKPESTTATSTILISDGNKVEPGQSGPKPRKPGGGLAGVVKSVQDTVNASISNVTDGLRGGATSASDTTTRGDTTKSGDTN